MSLSIRNLRQARKSTLKDISMGNIYGVYQPIGSDYLTVSPSSSVVSTVNGWEQRGLSIQQEFNNNIY